MLVLVLIHTSRYPVGISTEFCFRWQKKSSRWEGEGDKGGKGKKKKKKMGGGKKLKEKKERGKKKKKKIKGEKRKSENHGESNHSRASISLKSPMLYLSPTVTLKLHCEQFWTFIVIVTFDLRYCMRTNRQTRTIIIYIDCINNFDTAMEKQNSGKINEVTLAPNLKLSSFTEHPDTQLCCQLLHCVGV